MAAREKIAVAEAALAKIVEGRTGGSGLRRGLRICRRRKLSRKQCDLTGYLPLRDRGRCGGSPR